MATSRRKKVFLSAGVVLAVTALLGLGTMASFTAQTKNPGNAFANGTLVLSNTKQGGSACLSTGGGSTDTNVNDNCDTLLNLSVRKPGDSGTANLTVANVGSLDASVFKTFAVACTNGDASAESYHGTGSPCSKLQLYVQEWSDSGFSTASSCLYGGGTATTCDFSDTAKTLSDFQTNHNSSANGVDLGGVTAGTSKYYTIGVKLPTDADNTYQGRQATIDFTWFASE